MSVPTSGTPAGHYCHDRQRLGWLQNYLGIFLGNHLPTFSTKMQKSMALSSGEGELVAQVSGIIDGLGVRNLIGELGGSLKIRSFCDSSAARGILSPEWDWPCQTSRSASSVGSGIRPDWRGNH